jgi:PilZ domain-containing protein
MVHLALPVRWSLIGAGRSTAEAACTYDIHPRGARLLSSRDLNVGDMVLIERGRNKALFQVIWAADPSSPLRGQFSVQSVEGRTPWDEELRQLNEEYQPILLEPNRPQVVRSEFIKSDGNRRRRPRFFVEGQAEVIDGRQHVIGEVAQISEIGARIATNERLRRGCDFRLLLNVLDVTLALKAEVKYMVNNIGMGVEFHEIRRGDRPLLSYVLSRLRSNRMEEFVPVEVVSAPQVQAAG